MSYSGGLDSSAMLHAMAATGIRCRAVHVDHGLHEHSAQWAASCIERCHALGVPIEVLRVDVDRSQGKGLEAAARDARYTAIAANLSPGETLFVAHHADDQAETVLQRLLRGSGAGGLAGMREKRPLGAGWLVRPWLAVSRSDIAAYAAAHGIERFDDPSNADTRHDRNFLRHCVLPHIRERWPRANDAIGLSASWLRGAQAVLDERVALELARAATLDPHVLRIDALRMLDDFLLGECVRQWLDALGARRPSLAIVSRLRAELLDAGENAEPLLQCDGYSLRRYRNGLHHVVDARPPYAWSASWDIAQPLMLLGNAGELRVVDRTSPDRVVLRVHFREGGERFRARAGGPSRPLKDCLQALGVPPWERAAIPLVSDDEGLLAIGDLLVADRWARIGGRLRWERR